ncbi:amino acid permease [Chitinispirillales bacterium ANBcel5]|uniref:amino acid permease n=1 Tax=Cellulosispirillum alkaliphilum TaxID=3039283 RepID=UPI002A4EBE20|nr:amino acid permease [Chitinispirillales bacterium ANBcel5]
MPENSVATSPASTGTNTSLNSPTPGVPKKFSTFGGVFTPSILTILGVIMFMRAGFVVGHAGIFTALMVLGLSKLISILTSFSISAIATNTDVKGGGAYFLISRTLGPEFGGTIGITLFLAQTLSVPFYILGFTEALVRTADSIPFIPSLQPYFFHITSTVLLALFIVTLKGAGWAIRVQYVIMALLALSILAFMGGAALNFDAGLFQENLRPFEGTTFSFWALFAIYFPAVTGIMAGVNMSGNLKNPSRAIPLGTFAAIGVGLVIYAAQILLTGGAIERADLIDAPYDSLVSVAPFYTGFLVTIGVFCATLSSGLGSLLGAPRILQSLGQDRLLKPANFFAALNRDGEPRRALCLTFLISALVLWFARGGSEGGALNMVASLVTMLFLWTYGITNLAAFVESFSRNPSFRPRFKYFHWLPALIGAVASFGVSFLVDAPAALLATLFVVGLFVYVRRFVLEASFGDARRGFYYTRTKDHLFTLAQLPLHSKNWRPTIVVLSGNPNSRLALVKYADWLGSGRGIVTLAVMKVGQLQNMAEERTITLESLKEFTKEHKIRAFPEVLVTPDFDLGLNQFLQCTSIGPVKPNVVMLGWPGDPQRAVGFSRALKTASILNMSTVLFYDKGKPFIKPQKKGRIDIWWRGKRNGSLMVILAYLMTLNNEWAGTKIRILRVVQNAAEKSSAYEDMRLLIDSARMDIAIETILSEKPFPELLIDYSRDASVVFMGFRTPEEEEATQFIAKTGEMLKELPVTLLVCSTGEADLLS